MAAVGSILGQAIVLRVGLRPVAAIGMALMGGGALLLTQVSAGGSYFGDIFLGLLVFGPGVGFVFVTALIAALAGVPRRESGLASGLSKTSFQIGAALGLAIVTTVAVSRTEDYLAANTGENPLVALTEGFPVSLPRGRHLRRYRRRPPPFASRRAARRPAGPARARALPDACGATDRGGAGLPHTDYALGRTTMTDHEVVSREEWAAAREALLAREKEHTRLGDALAQQRRELPWVRVEKEYRFDTDDGQKTLAELFDGRSQLLVYHFMFGPSYEAGCATCSSMADGITGLLPHLHARDVTFVFVSQAPLEKLHAYKRRLGWTFPWVSSAPTDFNFDLGFSQTEEQTREAVTPIIEALPPIAEHNAGSSGTDLIGYLTQIFGFSAFVRDNGSVYHTYTTTGRGIEFLMGYYPILDHAPKGRNERDDWQVWIRRHDEY
jgi:predicted dithiol-disulfide oxidoreductase (DUF899 family)